MSSIKDIIQKATSIDVTLKLSPPIKLAIAFLVFVLSGIFLSLLAMIGGYQNIWAIIIASFIIGVICFFLLGAA